jgi:hypothetical protein
MSPDIGENADIGFGKNPDGSIYLNIPYLVQVVGFPDVAMPSISAESSSYTDI